MGSLVSVLRWWVRWVLYGLDIGCIVIGLMLCNVATGDSVVLLL